MKEDSSHLSPAERAKAERIAYLIAAFIREDITPAETEELDDWVGASNENVLLFEELTDDRNLSSMLDRIIEMNVGQALKNTQDKIASRSEKRLPVLRRLLPYIIAASIIGILIGVYVVRRPSRNNSGITKAIIKDISPGGNKATLTLSNGSIIDLDNTRNGEVGFQGNSRIIKTDSGKLSYELTANSQQPAAGKFNILGTPKGGQYQLTLPDGTHVWLNAQSSIRYPVVFSGIERTVELNGEAYFEVAKNAMMSFKVIISPSSSGEGRGEVSVLGTHFNINAYDDETEVKTTLLEGSVKIHINSNEALLKPGQQAGWDNTGRINFVKDVNTDDIVAWKTGMFSFHREDISSIMRQVSRWYDVDIKYEGEVKNHLNAAIERNVPVSRLLKLLEGTGDVHFDIQDKTIIVKP